jgi:4-hydroxymandelate oxidase
MEQSKFPYDFSAIKSICRDKLIQQGHPERVNNWMHLEGGAESGSTWRRNFASYQALGFNQIAINDVRQDAIDLSTTLLGASLRLPLGIAPMSAAIGFTCENAFAELAKACAKTGMIASVGFPSGPNSGAEMVAECANTFRLIKPLRNLERLIAELQKSEADGCIATGVDIDSIAGLKVSGEANHYAELAQPIGVADLKAARDSVKIPFIIKGVLSEQDAKSAIALGADAIIVSTHAGFALDYAPAPLEVLPKIIKAVDGKAKVFVDSGISRGSDIIKALCLGADGVLIGRLAIWGLLLGGSEGVEWIIGLLEDEMKRVMMLIGAQSIKDLNKDCLIPLNQLGVDILGK